MGIWTWQIYKHCSYLTKTKWFIIILSIYVTAWACKNWAYLHKILHVWKIAPILVVIYRIALNFRGRKLPWFSWLWMESRKFFSRIFSHTRQEWRNFQDFTKVFITKYLFRNRIQEITKVFYHESLELYGMIIIFCKVHLLSNWFFNVALKF